MKSKKQQILLQLQKRLYLKPMTQPVLLPEKIPHTLLLRMHGEPSFIASKGRSKAGLCMLHLHLKQLKKLLRNIKSKSTKVDYTQQDLVKKISYFINIWCYLQIIFFFSSVRSYSTAKLEFETANDFVYTTPRPGSPYAGYINSIPPFLGPPAVGERELGGRICIWRVKELKADLLLSQLKWQYLKGRLIVTNPKPNMLLAHLLYALITQGRLLCGGSIIRKGARSFLCYQISYKNKPPGSFVYCSLFTLGKAKNQLMSTSGVFIRSLLLFQTYTCNHIKTSTKNNKKEPTPSSPPGLRPRSVSKKHIKKNKTFYKYLSFCDYIVFKMVWKWCSRKHGNQSAQWIRNHYFYKLNGQSWVFALKKFNMLPNLAPCLC